jgi:lipoprotein-anchoring transpeptidase ErfK/SrfK
VEANPRWNRPDWDWLERGKKPPEPEDEIEISSDLSPEAALAYYRSLSKEEREEVRSVPGHLGAWKLSMGDGYYIHAGNLAGGHVSHGCVRVTPQDLSVIHELIPVGSSVFIY